MSRLSKIRHVRQEDPCGCVVASLAMIAGKSYSEVLDLYPFVRTENKGLSELYINHFCNEHGFAIQTKYCYVPDNRKRTVWPVEPWAEAHICMVTTHSNTTHAVVMLRDGTVLDPATEVPKRLADYKEVYSIRGIYDVWDKDRYCNPHAE